MLLIQSEEFVTVPSEFVIADTEKKRIVKSISIKGAVFEIYFKKIKRFYPYGNGFSTDSASIINISDAIYHFGKKFYTYGDDKFKEYRGAIKEKKELTVQKGCKYKIFEVALEGCNDLKYMIEPK